MGNENPCDKPGCLFRQPQNVINNGEPRDPSSSDAERCHRCQGTGRVPVKGCSSIIMGMFHFGDDSKALSLFLRAAEEKGQLGDVLDMTTGRSPFHFANTFSENGHARVLIEAMGRLELCASGCQRGSALSQAVRAELPSNIPDAIADLVLSFVPTVVGSFHPPCRRHSELLNKQYNGKTAWMEAVDKGQVDIARMLADAGAAHFIGDKVLISAGKSKGNKGTIIKWLVSHGTCKWGVKLDSGKKIFVNLDDLIHSTPSQSSTISVRQWEQEPFPRDWVRRYTNGGTPYYEKKSLRYEDRSKRC